MDWAETIAGIIKLLLCGATYIRCLTVIIALPSRSDMHQLAVGFIMKTGELKHSQQFHMTMIFDVIKIIEIEAVFLYKAFPFENYATDYHKRV